MIVGLAPALCCSASPSVRAEGVAPALCLYSPERSHDQAVADGVLSALRERLGSCLEMRMFGVCALRSSQVLYLCALGDHRLRLAPGPAGSYRRQVLSGGRMLYPSLRGARQPGLGLGGPGHELTAPDQPGARAHWRLQASALAC